jgi:large subunit ribosomal protein L1
LLLQTEREEKEISAMPKVSKRRKQLDELRIKAKTPQTAEEAIKLLKSAHTVKFDETVEVHFRLGINPKLNDQQIRSTVNLPGGTGKTVRVAVVAKGEKIAEAEAAGADIVGAEDLVGKIGEGFLEFDKLVATPDAMIMLSKLGKVLGPKGLMPNPKDGTVTFDVSKAIKELKAGKVSFRAEKDGGLVQMPIGKLSFKEDALLKNFTSVVDTIQKVKPATVKGTYIKAVYISSTMGPGVKIDLNKIADMTKTAAESHE